MPGPYLTLDELADLERQTGEIIIDKMISIVFKLLGATGLAFLAWFGLEMYEYHQELNTPTIVTPHQ